MSDLRLAQFRLHPLAVALLVSSLAAAFAVGCGDDEGPQEIPDYDFDIEVETATEDDIAVPGVPVALDGEVVGYTDSDGRLEATLREQPNEVIELEVQDIDGYRIVDDNPTIEETLRLVERLDSDGYRGVPVRHNVELQSNLQEHLLWVTIDCDDDLDDRYCQDVPVELDGELMARTDYQGTAHFPFETTSGTEHDIALRPEADDSDVDIEPESPNYRVVVGAESSVFYISESFTDPDPPRAYTPPPSSPQPSASSSDDEPDPEPEPEEPEEEDGDIIELF